MSNFLGTNQFSGKTEIQRFWEKVNKQSDKDCWEWIAGKNSKGYGQFRFKDKNWQAHRVSWVLQFGEIPKGLFICHHCDNPSCVNPEHLFIGTASDNANDMAKKGRSTRGEKSHTSKLTRQDVKEIRKLLSKKYTAKQLANQFDVSPYQIYNIKYKEDWAWLK